MRPWRRRRARGALRQREALTPWESYGPDEIPPAFFVGSSSSLFTARTARHCLVTAWSALYTEAVCPWPTVCGCCLQAYVHARVALGWTSRVTGSTKSLLYCRDDCLVLACSCREMGSINSAFLICLNCATVHTHIQTNTHTHIQIHTHTYRHTRTHTHTCIYVCMCVWVCVSVQQIHKYRRIYE